jgi:hypothetical protein
MKTIQIKDYVANDVTANAVITNFNNNKLIIKKDTGIGGTTSVLNITNKNVIIISPLSGMIATKEHKRQPHQMFIYQDSKDRWHYYEKEIQYGTETIVLNTTPEQIIELRKNNPSLFKLVMDIPFFVDESQVYSESDYRKSMNAFYDILFNHHRGGYTLSTATPTFRNLDIPKHALDNMELITLERSERRLKPISIAPLKNYWNFIKEHCEKGNKVVLFTNDINKIKNIQNADNFNYKVQLLVGETLAVKTSAIKTKSLEHQHMLDKSKVDKDADLYILSTKYLIGFDLEFDAAIGIIMDEASEVDCFNVNQIVQAYGRVRKKVVDAMVFYIAISKNPNQETLSLENNILAIDYDANYLNNIQPLISEINQIQSYPLPNLIQSLKAYDFDVRIIDNPSESLSDSRVDIASKYRNLIQQEKKDTIFLGKELVKVYTKIKGDDNNYNGYTEKHLLLWAAAYIALATESKYLLDYEPQRYDRLLLRAKTFIDVNDLEYPTRMTELDRITKFRVSEKAVSIAKKEGALCELKLKKQLIKDENQKLKEIEVLNETVYTEQSNLWYDDKFKKAKQIINSLYCIYLVEHGLYSDDTKRIIHGFSVVSECLIDDYTEALSDTCNLDVAELLKDDTKKDLEHITKEYAYLLKRNQVFKNSNQKIATKLKKLKGWENYNQKEIKQIMDKATSIKTSLIECKHGVRNTIKMNTYSLSTQLERHRYYILSLLSLACAGHTFGFKTTSRDNRIFNTATKTTRQLRPYTPYELIQCDIRSAFASFLDEMVGSNIALNVYSNIMNSHEVDRDTAKTLYNSMLNDYKRNPTDARTFFKSCGYTKEQVDKIIAITSKEKGSFYRAMTQKEEAIIKKFRYENKLDETSVRLHDALLIYNEPKNRNLITSIDNCLFDVKVL